MNVPDIGGLLGKISEKRGEMPKTPVQSVQPIQESTDKNTDPDKTVKTPKMVKSKTVKQAVLSTSLYRGAGGRPSIKKDSVEYVKMSPRIPKTLKKQVDIALIHERFKDSDGNLIKTLDEIVSLALERLLVEN